MVLAVRRFEMEMCWLWRWLCDLLRANVCLIKQMCSKRPGVVQKVAQEKNLENR